MSPTETAKQRAKRIDRQVLRGSRWLERGRNWLAMLAALLGLAWWGAGIVTRRADAWVSPGPLAAVHAAWTNDCKACHTEFQPIRADALLASRDARSVADEKCQTCHRVAHSDDPLGSFGHHALNSEIVQLGCATCHHEHQGTAQLLVRTSDRDCTLCHARDDLTKLVAGTPAIADIKPVEQFSVAGHPYFRSLGDPSRDGPDVAKPFPRKLKFAQLSHHLHMTLTVGQLNKNAQEVYGRGKAPTDLVQLNCASCHQLDNRQRTPGEESPPAIGPPHGEESGALMVPIVYERHCQVCHPLTIAPGVGEKVSHRLTAASLVAEVRKFWEDRYLTEHPEALTRARPLPDHAVETLDLQALEQIRKGNQQSAAHLSRVCGECHQFLPHKDGPAVSSDKYVDETVPRVAPVAIPTSFLTHARFNHAAHRASDCSVCHQEAYPAPGSPPAASREEPSESPLMIANRDACLKCHSPLQETSASPHGGARFDCAECHRYHNRQDTVTIQPPTN